MSLFRQRASTESAAAASRAPQSLVASSRARPATTSSSCFCCSSVTAGAAGSGLSGLFLTGLPRFFGGAGAAASRVGGGTLAAAPEAESSALLRLVPRGTSQGQQETAYNRRPFAGASASFAGPSPSSFWTCRVAPVASLGGVDAKRYVRVKVSFSEPELEQLRAEAKAEGRTLAGLIWARALRMEARPR